MTANGINWLRDWVIPVVAVIVAASGTWVRFEGALERHERDLKEMRARLDRVFGHGSDGFLDPEIRGLLDQYLHSRYDSRYVDQTQFNEWKRALFQLNRELEKPWMDKGTSEFRP